jgi:hypothetical protein
MGKVLEVAFDGFDRDLRHIQVVMFRDGLEFFAKFEGQLKSPRDADSSPTASIQ